MKTAHHRFAVAILALLVLSVPAWGADPIKAELDAAWQKYFDTVLAAEATLLKAYEDEIKRLTPTMVAFLKAFDDEMKKIAAMGDFDGYKALQADKEKASQGIRLPKSHPMRELQAGDLDNWRDLLYGQRSVTLVFERKGGGRFASTSFGLPKSDPMREHQVYRSAVSAANILLAESLNIALKKYTMKLEIDKATIVHVNLKKLLKLLTKESINAIKALGGSVDPRVPIGPLNSYKEIVAVSLLNTKVTDAGLVYLYLKWLPKLRGLNLAATKVTDSGLEHLKGLTELSSLDLHFTKVTDAGLEHLKGLTELKELYLSRTQITDAGLVHLKGLTKLETLYLFNTKVTDAGINKLQQALPKCRIFPTPSKP